MSHNVIRCPECDHETVIHQTISDDDTIKCGNCLGTITVSLEFEPAEEEEEADA